MPLHLRGYVDLPRHVQGGFDHGDVHLEDGQVFVAHTANGTVEIIDGVNGRHLRTVPGCPEASGVLCAQGEDLVFAAARAAAKVLVIHSRSRGVAREIQVGPRPNGLAWDPRRKHLLVADVEDLTARLVDPRNGNGIARVGLPGRPRWTVYDPEPDRFLVNIREPASVLHLAGPDLREIGSWAISAAGPHGLDLDPGEGKAFVACDGATLITLNLLDGREVGATPIAGEPDVLWFNPVHHRLYVAIGKPGLVEVIDSRSLRLIEQLPTEEGAHTTAFDRARQRLYVFLPHSCRAAIYEEPA